MVDVCLVLMPYMAIERPSIALGLLKAALNKQGIQATVVYANIWFAEEVGLDHYVNFPAYPLRGEWTFSQAAFPDFQANDSEFLDWVTADENKTEDLQQVLGQMRQAATPFIKRVAQSVLALRPRIVACSSTFEQHCASLAVLRQIRQLAPEVITFMGGANCEASMGQVTQQAFPWVDFVVSGEGDETVPALCRLLLDQGRDLDAKELPYGVIAPSHRSNGALVGAAPRASVQNLDQIPIPDYDDYFQALRDSPIGIFVHPGLPIETSRGCWWGQKSHCTFCGLNGKGMTYRSKSPQRVVAEFTHLSQRYGVRKFQVVDNILDLKHIDTVLPTLAALKDPYTIFYETKANLTWGQIKQLAESGVCFIQPGIESLHDQSLKLMKKGNTALMNVQLLKWTREFGIAVAWNYLIDIPGERDEWFTATAQWLPLIFHLYPPHGGFKIRFDRFSPYHEQSAAYGLTLFPDRAYAYVYPLSSERMKDFVYFFEDATQLQEESGSALSGSGKGEQSGCKALKALIQQWSQLFFSKDRPVLRMMEDGEQIRIIDTRPIATCAEHHLEGLACWVYKVCDRVRTPGELVRSLHEQYSFDGPWEIVQATIADLQQRKILLELNGRFLSLAFRGAGVPYIKRSEVPGGYIDLRRYRQAMLKKLWIFQF
ncbi:MAG: RiPP maturation radical SAM C-methyltransferase [Xenococcaceae cyanobacterium]